MSQNVFQVSRSVSGRAWVWRGGAADEGLGPDAMIRRLFLSRGARAEEIDMLRAPTIRDMLPDPSIFRDMDAAAARIADAVERGERIVLFGDYDVDGATSASVLIRALAMFGARAGHYIPDRLLEGYGPSADALVNLKQAGADLVVCVDCGTQGFEALEAARAAGLDVIVVDHHKASTELPPAAAIVNPNRIDEGVEAQGYGHLAAAGMSFLVTVAVRRELARRGRLGDRPPNLMPLLDLVALGTVADVVPLTGLNRAFVAQGLKIMARRGNRGLSALADAARLERAPLASDLGFALGPRINAGGRVGRADLGVRLLCGAHDEDCQALAEELSRLNEERRAIEADVTDAALAAAERAGNMPVAVVSGEGWHPGVIGIAASRLKDRLGAPAIVIGTDAGIGKGSGRSISGVDLGAAVLAAKDAGLLSAGGGHAMAAGLTVVADRIGELTDFLCERLEGQVTRAQSERSLAFDLAVAPGGITPDLAESLDLAAPYGAGWPTPRVAAGPVSIVEASVVGNGHVRTLLAGADGKRAKGIAFRAEDTPLGAALLGANGRRLFVAGRVKRDDWQQVPRAEIHIEDAAWADGAAARAA
ncbi:single-stranded-DNA-specific exonuclease RecJ [Pacificimonas flava]|uniref:Single-stranded-DNA-specific exonuclease RecJ n=2 Tax=Pacificimonas TaxID=1960290 RepID=A0A219B1W4_9SPHN|nr:MULTISPECIES: single-stranded-DNA-specific exonuclease RecJ [Pacificimonas]MBZ6378018.1 single-stranded-DNA-specific exonuclease RecJ [Pacificimonas aurantium]OWV32337.1 single-stranded-DNA-specific exonuclease RecJ [Pacificimonas flava]